MDTSSNNGSVNWDQVKASGIAAGITKRSESTGYADPTFEANWDALGRLGMPRGCYHFGRPETNAPLPEATYFVSLLPTLSPGDVLVLDLETGAGPQAEWALTWLAFVKEKTGVTPWLYTGAYHLQTCLQDARLAAYPLWLASYVNERPGTMTPPNNIWPWISPALWQWSQTMQVPGVTDDVDESVTAHTVAEMKGLGKPGAHPVTPSKPPAPFVPYKAETVVKCALKPDASHTSKAKKQLSTNSVCLVLTPPTVVNGESWSFLESGKDQGYVPTVLLKRVSPRSP